jgi:hypothetical protein
VFEVILTIHFLIFPVVFICYFYKLFTFKNKIKNEYPELYKKLGDFDPITNNTFRTNSLFFKFLSSKIDCPVDLKTDRDQLRILLYLSLSLFLLSLFYFLYGVMVRNGII